MATATPSTDTSGHPGGMPQAPPTQRALISCADKSGIEELARALTASGVEIVSTGGTARHLRELDIEVTDIADVTGAPELLDGRVKTLHMNVHAALLASPRVAGHLSALDDHDIEPFDLVVVNLYRFDARVHDAEVSLDDALEQVDIGGPAMLRAAAKNLHGPVAVVDPADYPLVVEHAAALGELPEPERLRLAARAFAHTAAYDATIANYLAGMAGEQMPQTLTVAHELVRSLRYGENPHQRAALYRARGPEHGSRLPTLADARQLQGSEASYTNLLDADAALRQLAAVREPCAVAVKHAAPCGVGIGTDPRIAYGRCRAADPISIFGGVVGFNRVVDEPTAEALCESFLEVLVAPGYSPAALELIASRRPNLRLLEVDPAGDAALGGYDADGWMHAGELEVRSIAGGLLVQERDAHELAADQFQVATVRAPEPAELDAMLLGWKVARSVRSNAIVLATPHGTVGLCGGQPNRVDAARMAIQRAGDRAAGSVLASDGFIPMVDTIEVAAEAGITAIIQPGGSRGDLAAVRAADAAGIAMVMTGIRHFAH